MEHIEKMYRREELGKTKKPPRRVWRAIRRRMKFRKRYRYLFIFILILIILVPFTCSELRKQNSDQIKNIDHEEHPSESKGRLIHNNIIPKTGNALSRRKHFPENRHSSDPTKIAARSKEDLASLDETFENNSTHPEYAENGKPGSKKKLTPPIRKKHQSPEIRSIIPEKKQKAEITDLLKMCPLDAHLDPLVNPTLITTKDSLKLKKINPHRKTSLYAGYAYTRRNYEFVSNNDTLTSEPLNEWQKGIAAGVRIPISKRWWIEGGVEFLNSKAHTKQTVRNYRTDEVIEYIGTGLDPLTGDTIPLYDTTNVVTEIDSSAFTPVKIKTLNFPVRCSYVLKRNRFGIEAALGLCYQISKFYFSPPAGTDIPRPFDGSQPLSLDAFYVTGDLRISYLFSEHLEIYLRTSCRGLIFEKSDYIKSTSSPGYGLFSGGITYQF